MKVMIKNGLFGFFLLPVLSAVASTMEDSTKSPDSEKKPEEVEVIGSQDGFTNTDYSSVKVTLDKADFQNINMSTVEDAVAYAPGLVVRRRFIGDANGVVGMRGSNMFQTARTMVFADGMPLHYLLQTRWGGAPRWSLVGPDEASSVEVVYGPFSAEYSGNAMGGVINIETKMPERPTGQLKAAYFVQDYDYLGTDDRFDGGVVYAAYGDRREDFSYFVSFNHLENEGHPQSLFFARGSTPAGTETPVTGTFAGNDSKGNPGYYFGDTGPSKTSTDLLKIKLGYEIGSWQTRTTVAFEQRDIVQDEPNNYLSGLSGDAFWNGSVVVDGEAFAVTSGRFQEADRQINSILLGLGASGPISQEWSMEIDASHFDLLDDEESLSAHNRHDPAHNGTGTVSEYDDTGWDTLDVKWHGKSFLGQDSLTLLAGVYADEYRMNYATYNSTDYDLLEKTSLKSKSGGETSLNALFAQLGWQINKQWDATFGVRQERWKTDGEVEARSDNKTSPKMSVGYQSASPLNIRYSLAKAYRFPIVEELYKNESTANSMSIANIGLEPENGLHQSLSFEYPLQKGSARVSLFHEVVKDAIFNQTAYLPEGTVNTFVAINEVTVQGIELEYVEKSIAESPFDLRVNLTFTDAEITKNEPNPAVEGNDFPRIPEYRANVLLTYHINDPWDASMGLRYASHTYDTMENTDNEDEVFGAQDEYRFVNLKTNYRLNTNVSLGFGIDNVTNETAFVAHPWPQRTVYAEASYSF